MEKLNLLLKQISEIVLKEKILQEEKRKLGENFNIFNVLGLSTSEVRLHSAFIAELLNPNGDHGLGSKFMESFIDNVIEKKCPCPFLFESSSAKVYVEYSIGNVTDDKIQKYGQLYKYTFKIVETGYEYISTEIVQ